MLDYSRFARYFNAAALFFLSGFVIAQAQTASVPLNTLTVSNGPQGGVLSNGIGWNVDKGSIWFPPPLQVDAVGGQAGYYGFRPNDTTGVGGPDQTWTFTQAVNLSFIVNGLQGDGEGIKLPAGTQCTFTAANPGHFTWNPAIGILQHNSAYSDPDGGAAFMCTLDNVTTLKLIGVDNDPLPLGTTGNRRGLRELKATIPLNAKIAGIPSNLALGSSVNATLTCTNNGLTNPATNVNCVPSLPAGSGTISNVSCSPNVPVASQLPGVAGAITCGFTYTAPTNPGNATIIGTTTATVGAGPSTHSDNVSTTINPAITADINTSITGIPSSMAPGTSAQGTLTCTNNGASAVANVGCVPSVPAGSGTISNISCTPTTPVPSLNIGAAVSCTFTLTAPNTTGVITVIGTPSTTTAGITIGSAIASVAISLSAPIPSLGILSLITLASILVGFVMLFKRKPSEAA